MTNKNKEQLQAEMKALVLEVLQHESTIVRTVKMSELDVSDDKYINMTIELKTVLE